MWARAIILTVGAALFLGGCMAVGRPMAPEVSAHDPKIPPQARAATGKLLTEFERAMDMVDELRFGEALVKLTEIEPLMTAVGDRQRAALCLFWRGFCEEKLSRPAQARARYGDVLAMYGDTVAADMARRRLAILNAPES